MGKMTRKKMSSIICEIAWNIEQYLMGKNADLFFADMAGIKPENVSDVALKLAIKEFKDALNPNTEGKPGRDWVYGIIAKHLL